MCCKVRNVLNVKNCAVMNILYDSKSTTNATPQIAQNINILNPQTGFTVKEMKIFEITFLSELARKFQDDNKGIQIFCKSSILEQFK